MHIEILNDKQKELLPLISNSKWKDYVDLFFIIKNHYSLDEIQKRAFELFGDLFSDKLFRSQLSYYDDVDYSEEVDYLTDTPPSDNEIKDFLTQQSTDISL